MLVFIFCHIICVTGDIYACVFDEETLWSNIVITSEFTML